MTQSGLDGLLFESKGETLIGALFLAAGPGRKPTALVLHGIPGIEKNHDICLALQAIGWNALVFHYRGSWGSSGEYTFAGLPEDAVAAIDALVQHPAVDPDRIIAIGHSMGGFTAVLTGVRDVRVKAVCAIGMLGDVRGHALGQAEHAAEYAAFLPGTDATRLAASFRALGDALNPCLVAGRLSPRPLLVIHGGQDEIVPLAQHGQAVFDAASEPKQLRVLPEGDHGFTWWRDWLVNEVVAWVEGLDL